MPSRDRRRQHRSGPVTIISTFEPQPLSPSDAAFHATLRKALVEERRINVAHYKARLKQRGSHTT